MENRIKHIELVPYNPNWPSMFQLEAATIKQVLTDNVIEIHHIGSTSIPGLKAKQDIDILCVVKELPTSLLLKDFGYLFKGELNIPLRYYFSKNTSQSKVNLHVVEQDHGFINCNLYFRDYLRKHKDARLEYAALKEHLLSDHRAYQRNKATFSGYNLGKNQFIKDVLKKAGFNNFNINFCMHDNEWATYHRIREEQIFNTINTAYDRNHSSITAENNYHFILYKGINIVAVAHVELLQDGITIALRSLATDSQYKKQGCGRYIMQTLEKLGKYQKQQFIKMHARLSAEQFYRKLGYVDMPFDDPSIQKEYIDLGKEL
ncbi:MAG: bifunctional GrpB family protein/GNAT family N-acetyltransferase [Gammaproteobacteria bacterium]